MIKRLLTFVATLYLPIWVIAQIPENIKVKQINEQQVSLRNVPTACNDAGAATLTNPSGQSNDFVGPTVFLCQNDRISIVHDGNFDLSGDPDNSTPPGIGYIFYDEFPTISGSTLDSILMDPSLNKTSPVLFGGVPSNQDMGLWIAAGTADGNLDIINDGSLQAGFNNGIPAPIQFWFAPVTLDDFTEREFEDGGECVNVNISRAFSIVYLNEITIASIDNNTTPSTGCEGRITISGGLPEFDANEFYDITISLQDDPTVQATFTALAGHDDDVRFSIPQPGIYDIVVEDGKSCGATGTVDFSACRAVTFNLPFVNADPGETNVCLDVTVQDFVDVGAVQFSVQWDPTVLDYQSVQGLNTNMPGLNTNSFNEDQVNNGQFAFVWPSLGITATTLANDESLFQICFNVIGALGTSSPVQFTDSPTDIQVGDDVGPFNLGYIFNDGQVNVSQNAIFLELEADSVQCNGENSGAITVKFGDGTEPYTIQLDTVPNGGGPFRTFGPLTGLSELEIIDLFAGDYEVTIFDDAGNTLSATTTISEPANIGGRFIISDAACFGDSIPEIRAEVRENNIRVNGPESRYTFTWDTPWGNNLALNTSVLSDVPPGDYSVTVTGRNGCFTVISSSVFTPDEILVPPGNIIIDPASCSGSGDGSIAITPEGGVVIGDYLFQWDGAFQESGPNSTLGGINPGFYTVSITDNNNCVVEQTFEVTADKTILLALDSTDVSCFGDSTGVAIVNASTLGPESLPYTYEWTNEQGTFLPGITSGERSNSISDLPAGTYFVRVQDNDPIGCEATDTIVINQPDSIAINPIRVIDETCINGGGAMDAEVTIEVSGGTFPYEYLWTNTDQDTVGMDSSLVMLSADTLQVRLTDANSCLDSIEVIVRAPNPPFIRQKNEDVLDCFDDTNGTISVDVDPNGLERIDWLSATGAVIGNGPTLSDLGPGVYFVRPFGTNQCASIDSLVVSAPPPLMIDSIVVIRTPTCPGNTDGRFEVFITGGNANPTFNWQGPNVDVSLVGEPTLTELGAGSYNLTLIDGNNCQTLSETAVMTDPPVIDVTYSAIDSTSCFSENCDNLGDGQATATAEYLADDGTRTPGFFNFFWESSGELSNAVQVSTASQLCAGFNVLRIDDGICPPTRDSVNIPSPPPITPVVDITNVSCNGDADGEVSVMGAGGVGPYTYLWNTGTTGTSLANLAQGVYNVTITDANDCIFNQFINIMEPPPLILDQDQAFVEDESCPDANDGAIMLLPFGGTRPYSYQWNNGGTSDQQFDLMAGDYEITVTDANNCMDTLAVSIIEPLPLMAIIPQPENPRCFGDPTTLVIDSVWGGAGTVLSDYVYSVGNTGISFPVDQPTSIFDGVNVITIEDANGCQLMDTVSIQQPEQLEVIFDPERVVIELGDSTVQLSPTIINSPNIPVDSFIWTPNTYLSSDRVENPFVNPLRSQEYTLVVVDVNGCTSDPRSVFVELDANRNVHIPNVFSPNGDGENDIFSMYACNGVSQILSAHIYDRWGELIFSANDLSPNCEPGLGTEIWDGTLNGQTLNPGVFVYVVEVSFIDDISLTYRGSILLMR